VGGERKEWATAGLNFIGEQNKTTLLESSVPKSGGFCQRKKEKRKAERERKRKK
jgi:hypothetical protein